MGEKDALLFQSVVYKSADILQTIQAGVFWGEEEEEGNGVSFLGGGEWLASPSIYIYDQPPLSTTTPLHTHIRTYTYINTDRLSPGRDRGDGPRPPLHPNYLPRRAA